jgi:hypothetical protein
MTDFIVVLYPEGPKTGTSTPCSVSDIISMETDELLALDGQEGFGTRKQEALTRLVCSNMVLPLTALTLMTQAFDRDGARCVMTGVKFRETPTDINSFRPDLANIIPNSIHGKVCDIILMALIY